MTAHLRLWWQKIKKHRVAIGVVAIILAVVIVLIIVEIRLYGIGFVGRSNRQSQQHHKKQQRRNLPPD